MAYVDIADLILSTWAYPSTGHTGATSGPRSTGLQRTTPVTTGPLSAPLIDQMRADVAGRLDDLALPDTEEVTPTPRAAGQP
jgi:hypothetical protein